MLVLVLVLVLVLGGEKVELRGGSKVYMEGSDGALVHRGECLMRIASHEWLAGGGERGLNVKRQRSGFVPEYRGLSGGGRWAAGFGGRYVGRYPGQYWERR